LADSIKELSQDAHRTIDAEMRFGVGARQKKLNLSSMVRARISVSTTANFRCGV
jgi:hypothetical protein